VDTEKGLLWLQPHESTSSLFVCSQLLVDKVTLSFTDPLLRLHNRIDSNPTGSSVRGSSAASAPRQPRRSPFKYSFQFIRVLIILIGLKPVFITGTFEI
jgi:hypothetical protein